MRKILLAVICTFSLATQLSVARPTATYSGNKITVTLPASLLGKDLLMGSRIVDLSKSSGKVYAAGQIRNVPQIVRFERIEGNEKLVTMAFGSTDYICTSEDAAYKAAIDSNNRPTYNSTIALASSSSEQVVIDFTKYLSDSNSQVWPLPANMRFGKIIPELTKIEGVTNYKDHTNIRIKYAFGGDRPFSITVQYFLMALNETPLEARFASQRVGYQPIKRKIFEQGNKLKSIEQISRWRIEPKDNDIAKYLRGELVEPKEQIVFYIDPAFPKAWRPYIIKGIESWNMAFEEIGFRNVIQAKECPTDSTFDPYDIKVNMVRYIPTSEANAAGQTWIDPRSGEILTADILWWNDVINHLKKWRFLQTAASDPAAREVELPMELLGEMIRYTFAHEMGHVLGLQHNLRSSYAYPTDSLHSVTFTRKYGTTASIMDYARFNHIATAKDVKKGVNLMPPHLGPFDYASLAYGYLYRPGASAKQVEQEVFGPHIDDPMYSFAPMASSAVPCDPSAQSETLGNCIESSSKAGIENLQTILKNLEEWTFGKGGDIELFQERYSSIMAQYFKYISLIGSNVGGVYEYHTADDDPAIRLKPISIEKMERSFALIIKLLAESSSHLMHYEQLKFAPQNAMDEYFKGCDNIIGVLLNNFAMQRIVQALPLYDGQYNMDIYFAKVDYEIWHNLDSKNRYHHYIAASYIRALKELAAAQKGGKTRLAQISAQNQLTKTIEQLAYSEEWNYLLNINN